MKNEVKNIIKIANQQRKKCIINVTRHDNFEHGCSKEGMLGPFPGKDNKHEDKDGLDYQIKLGMSKPNMRCEPPH